jgi:tetratricopeptide (TPR) repeat protein
MLTEPWLADSLHRTPLDDTRDDDATASLLFDAGLHFRSGGYPWFYASAGRLQEAIASGEQFISILVGTPGTWLGSRSVAAFSYFGLGIAYVALGRHDEARHAFAQARVIYEGVDHHILIAFTFLTELREVALTYDAADPSIRRRIAAEAEAALGRAGGALRPGFSPRLAWLSCYVLDGRWDEAFRILDDLPVPGNAYLRREITFARSILARHRGEPDVAWAQINALLVDGPQTEPGDLIYQEGLWLQRLAAELCLDAGDLIGARAWLVSHDAWLAWNDSMLGQAEGEICWARVHLLAGDLALARERATAALTAATDPGQPLARLAAHRLLGEIETADGHLPDAERHLLAALDLAAVCEAPFEHALTLLPLAEVRAVLGHGDEAVAHIEEVREVGQRLSAGPLLAQADNLAARLARQCNANKGAEGPPARHLGRE